MAGTFHGFGGNPQHAAPESPLEIVSHHGPCLIIGLAGGGHYDPHLFPGHAGPILGDSGGGVLEIGLGRGVVMCRFCGSRCNVSEQAEGSIVNEVS